MLGAASEQLRGSFEVARRRVNEADANNAVDVEVDSSWVPRSCCVGKVHAVFKKSFLGLVIRKRHILDQRGGHALVA